MMRVARRLVTFAFAAVVAAGRSASADPPANRPGPQVGKPDPWVEKADQLFFEAKALESSNLREACDKYTESLHYNPTAFGTLLNVALCNEKLGRVASAVARFTEARDNAREFGLPELMRAAEDHLAALEPKIPHLAIRLTQQLPETKVLVDDHVVAIDALGDIAIDPGEHVVVVSAPDRLPHRATIVIAPAERKAIVIPALARSVTATSSWRRIGQIATFTGGAAFITSVGLAVYGHDREADATVVGGVGLAVAAAGAVLWYFSPHSFQGADAQSRVALDVTGDHVGVIALGRF
ncbi:MAG TPA: hypothetical protein VHT91_05420 [Kofleriaceae bacterium]|jgi:hypothetical protein|nr:hypothetical protein [Kofleriaceae bacterium]